jgi:transposase-like protein
VAGHFLHTPSARNFSLADVDAMGDDQVWKTFMKLRWGESGKQTCPACGSVDFHFEVRTRRQWRCRENGCGRFFSVTSGTKFADHKLPLRRLLKAVVLYTTAVKGISASQLARTLGVAYMTAFTLLHKLREALYVTRDLEPMDGLVHIDGAHFSGRVRKPRKKRPDKPQQHRSRVPRTANHWHPNRRIIMVVRQCSTKKGRGAVRTIVECVPAEDVTAVNLLAKLYLGENVTIMTDEHPAYVSLAARYEHFTVNHGTEFCTDDGVSNNQAESFFTRARRLVVGQIHRITPKYMLDYANEIAWREDVRRQPTKLQIADLMAAVLNSGTSTWWRGYWQGHHREAEIVFTDLAAVVAPGGASP